MFSLPELQGMLELRKAAQPIDIAKHNEYIKTLGYVARTFDLSIPKHWLRKRPVNRPCYCNLKNRMFYLFIVYFLDSIT